MVSFSGSGRPLGPRIVGRWLALGLVLGGLVTAEGQAQPSPAAAANTLTEAERRDGWKLLFDGKTTAGWRSYGKRELASGWQVVDGALTRVGLAGDIVAAEEFANFELALEWSVAKGGNSGIFYRGIEGPDPIFRSAPEMQVLDDAEHADGKSLLTSAGSNYGLYPVPRSVAAPAGQWNQARIRVSGNQVEHWLNGIKVVEYQLGSDEWRARVKASKFAAWPAYGTARRGLIGLQDHGDRVAFRSIKIRVLP
ncbi:MAG: DUF1080 domain-containing protein [Gemmatimonadales bacterium]|nr:DUF1080 domain-containing protein [Gemmatimonadales bacterium]